MKRSVLLALLFCATAAASDELRLRYGGARDDVASETSLSITITGTDAATNFVRSLHPILSLERLHLEAEGTLRVKDGKYLLENDDARAEVRYDGEEKLYDFKRSELPPSLAQDKLAQFVVAVAAGRRYALSPAGQYRSEQADQDHVGEALDLIALAVVRLPEGAVLEGDAWTRRWKGARTERGKKGKFAFTQRARLVRFTSVEGRRVAEVEHALSGELDGEKDPNALEQWTRCRGTGTVRLEVATGRVLESHGRGEVEAYYRALAEDGSKNEVRIVVGAEGRMRVRS